ncbi:MAG: ribonuclease III [Endomicrobia bacterium]|nr:ribonuclease III [Endomicrobiia bacterium]
MKDIEELESRLGINFKNKELLITSLTHKSWSVQNKSNVNNERLEFLGDSVLSVVVSEFLYQNFADKPEGYLSKLKSVLVSKVQITKWSKEIKLDKYLMISTAEEAAGGRKKETILAGVFEALLGAIYLDQGIEVVRNFLVNNFLSKSIKNLEIQDHKSLLQEIIQKEFKKLPEYEIIKETGPDHDKVFDCVVKIDNKVLGEGRGKTKKQSQQNAAKEALKKLGYDIK